MDRYLDTSGSITAFSKEKIIDCHTHVREVNDIQKLVDVMKEANIDMINVACLPVLLDEYVTQNLLGLLFKVQKPGKIFAFGGLEYPNFELPSSEEEFLKQVEELMVLGFDGIKMIEGKPNARKGIGAPLYSHIYDGFYSYLENKKIPIIFHVGDPGSFWDAKRAPAFAVKSGWTYLDGTYPKKEELYGEVEELLKRYPGLNIIFPHFYFMGEEGIERASRFLNKWPNVSFDITPGIEMYDSFSRNSNEWREFFIKYQDRILFGTDNDYGDSINIICTMRRFLETEDQFSYWGFDLKGICLPKDVLEKIYGGNFIRYTGEVPKDVNVDLLMKKYNEIRKQVENSSFGEKLIEEMDRIYEGLSDLL